MLVPQLEIMELGIYTLKKLLKQCDPSLFEETIGLVRSTLKESHLTFNPDSETYKGDELAAKEAREKIVKETMDKLKANKIKKGIKKDELEAIYRTLFDLMDANHDGVLEQSEFKEFMNANYELHGVKQGSAEIEEHKIKRFFDMLDDNKDGVLTWDEIWSSLSVHYRAYYE